MPEKPSLLIIGNSNVGKTSITRLLLPNPKQFKGKRGKSPGSTLLIRPISQKNLPYKIVDLPGFGFMRHSSRRRQEHVKKQIVIHVEKNNKDYFCGIVVINIIRIEDEITKYFLLNPDTIPLSFELINFLDEYDIPILIILNKIDKLTKFDKNKSINLFIESAGEFNINLIHLDENNKGDSEQIPYLDFSALKKINLAKLKRFIRSNLP